MALPTLYVVEGVLNFTDIALASSRRAGPSGTGFSRQLGTGVAVGASVAAAAAGTVALVVGIGTGAGGGGANSPLTLNMVKAIKEEGIASSSLRGS